MTDATRATRTTVTIGSIQVDGFMLPDGSYRMSQAQAAQTIGEPPNYALRFLRSNNVKALLGEAYTDYTPDSVEVEPDPRRQRGQTRIQGWTLEIVFAYWVFRCFKGNVQARNLVLALGTETLERRFDAAFGVERTERERNERLSTRIEQLEGDLSRLGETYALDDVVRDERDYFERLLRENGIDPWQGSGK